MDLLQGQECGIPNQHLNYMEHDKRPFCLRLWESLQGEGSGAEPLYLSLKVDRSILFLPLYMSCPVWPRSGHATGT